VFANVAFNPRAGGREDCYWVDDILYKERYSIERTNAWLDSYRSILNRFDVTFRCYLDQLASMELYGIYCDFDEKSEKEEKVKISSTYNKKSPTSLDHYLEKKDVKLGLFLLLYAYFFVSLQPIFY
jgi:hypothetical protein